VTVLSECIESVKVLNKTYLRRAVKTLFLCFVFVFLFILFRFSTWSPYIDLDTGTADLGSGEVKLIKLNGKRYWAVRLAPTQRAQLSSVASFTYATPYCDDVYPVCLMSVETERQGILIRQTTTKPSQLKRSEVWFGGFVNPANGAVYDLMGRGYRSNPIQAARIISVEFE